MPAILYGTLFERKAGIITNFACNIKRMKKILDLTVKENRKLNEDNFLLVLHSPELPEINAGQFVNVKVEDSSSTFLRRPISIHDVDAAQGLLYLLVKIAGKGTEKLSTIQPGEKLNIILPLGNWFSQPQKGKCLLVGGGVGIAPLLHLSKELRAKGLSPVVLIGTRSSKERI